MKVLADKVALVAGASRGCGRGIAIALGDAGATVYASGRTTRDGPKPVDGAPGTIEDTAEEVNRRGGHGIPVHLDHTDPAQVGKLFAQIRRDHGRLDILACAVWGGNERYLDPVWNERFWEQPARGWEEFVGAGPQAFWLAAREAARIMVPAGSGLILAVSEPILEQASDEQGPWMSVTFSHLAHYSINQLVRDLGRDARASGVAVIGLLPGFMKTERVQMHLPDEKTRKESHYDLAESTEYSGRAVVALATDPNVLTRTGKLVYVADLAEEYGFTDIDGKRVGNFYKIFGLIP